MINLHFLQYQFFLQLNKTYHESKFTYKTVKGFRTLFWMLCYNILQ